MTRNEYKHSTARLILLLVQFAVLCYSIFGDDEQAVILALLLIVIFMRYLK